MTSPEAPQPKQWNRSGTPPTDSEGVESSWNGQQPMKPCPRGVQLDAGGGDDLVDRVRGPDLGDVDRAGAGGHGSITRTGWAGTDGPDRARPGTGAPRLDDLAEGADVHVDVGVQRLLERRLHRRPRDAGPEDLVLVPQGVVGVQQAQAGIERCAPRDALVAPFAPPHPVVAVDSTDVSVLCPERVRAQPLQ